MEDLFGPLMVDVDGKYLSEEDKNILNNKYIGGIILFSKNFESFEQLQKLIKEIKKVKKNILIAVDQEGGRVQRFHNEFTKIPSMQNISKYAIKYNHIRVFQEIGWLISSELIASGVDLNFSPVLDLDENTSSIISDRAFSDDKSKVTKFASKYIDGMHEAGMKSTAKHFPGHGGVHEDSHIDLPVDDRSLEELLQNDIEPYLKLKGKIDAVMCAHVLFSSIDKNIPSYSKFWIQKIIRNKLDFDCIVFSDDLSMYGAGEESYYLKTLKSLNAGCDMVLICNKRNHLKEVLDNLEKSSIKLSNKLSNMKKYKDVSWNDLNQDKRALNIRELLSKI